MPCAENDTSVACIQEVWQENMEEEFKKICLIVQDYPYIAMDTEFPGIVLHSADYRNTSEYLYKNMKMNVDVMKIIQIGLTFMDQAGNSPSPISTWQFNFKFNLGEDVYAQNSIDLLASCGIKFERHLEDGIEVGQFAELLTTSGIVLCDNVWWLSFHSVYDFGYLLKILTNSMLPEGLDEFMELLHIFFHNIYDVKYLMKSCKNLKGGLQEVAEQLEIVRIGPQHQAGSDSLLTGAAFFKMKEMFFEDHIDDLKYSGHISGLGANYGTGTSSEGTLSNTAISISSTARNGALVSTATSTAVASTPTTTSTTAAVN